MAKDSVLQNIYEQPKVIEELVVHYLDQDGLRRQLQLLQTRKFANIIITGMGTSFFSGYPAFLYLQAQGMIHVHHVDASELLHYHMQSVGDDTLLILVSQSGESYEIVKILETIRNANSNPVILGLTMTDQDTTLKRHATICLPLAKTEETTLGAFKSFTASILLLMFTAQFICPAGLEIHQMRHEIIHLKNLIIKEIDYWQKYFKDTAMAEPAALCFIGRGPCLCAAQGAALIATELAKINAMVFGGGQFRHGPIEMAASHANQYVVLAPCGKTQDICLNLANELSTFKEDVLLLTADTSLAENDHLQILRMPAIDEFWASVLYSVPLQLFAYQLAVRKGIEPGTARIISKVTLFE